MISPKYYISWFIAIVTCLLSPIALSQVTVYGIEIPGLHQRDGKGVYDEIIDDLLVSEGSAALKVLPGVRAERAFSRCSNCCITPTNSSPVFYDWTHSVQETKPMNMAEIYIFSPHGSVPFGKLDELSGKKVAIRRSMAMSFGNLLDDVEFKITEVDSIKQEMTMLNRGRIDAYIDFNPDVKLAAMELGVDMHSHALGNPIARHPDTLVCRGVSESFISSFNKKLEAMKDKGQIKLILGDSLIDY